ncbi:MAG: SusC/RagA family TonB-linked outer membrane protein, partial [Candidatus Nephrothrix sp. EaCA]
VTGADGVYSLSVEDANAVLVYSFIGYETQEAAVESKSNIDIRLAPSQKQLNEVVVVGYGEQKRSSLTGAVGSVSAKEIQKLSVGNVGNAIQGRTPGVTVNTDGGVAGGAVNILIRGASSLTNVSPLYVIDGAFANSLSGVNLNDVESIEVLKDAAAAAIYGSRAANGVVLITTKKGKSGSVQINVNTNYSLQTPSKYLSFVNAQEYAKMITEIAGREGRAVPVRVSNLNPSIDEDYQRLWFGNAAMYNFGLDASGGQKNSAFFTSFNYFDQKSILAFSDFKRYDFRLNNTIKKGKFKLEEFFSANRTENKPNYAYSGSAYGFDIPILPARNPNEALWGVNSNGYASGLPREYYIADPPSSSNPSFTANNMLATGALSKFQENATILTGGLKASYELLKDLTYSFGINGHYNAGNTVYDIAAFTLLDIDGANPAVQNRNFTESNGLYFQYTTDNLFSYKKSFKKHDWDALIGQSWLSEHSRTTSNIAGPSNFVSNTVTVPQGAIATAGYEYGAGLLSFFGRANYSFDNRYLVSFSVRRDASSKFAKENRAGVFPSVSVGWNIHNEHFFKSKFISMAKLRVSYGELGANFIPSYSYISTVRSTVPATLGDQSRRLGTITELANPNLKWETSKTVNAGADIGLWNDKIMFTADYFIKNNTDLLASLTPPLSSGRGLDIASSTYFVNSANVQNKGLELSLGYRFSGEKFKYSITANAAHITNKVIALGDNVQPILGYIYSGSFDAPTITQPGLPIGSFWGYQTNGLYQSDAEVPQAGIEKGKRAGDLKFVNTNNDNIIDAKDKVSLGNPFPKWEYGINLSGNYNSFDFTAYFTGTQGNDIFNANKYSSYFLTTKANTKDVLDAWTPTNTNTQNPRTATGNAFGLNAVPNSFFVENGSYLRLRNAQVGYTFLKLKFKKLPFEKFRAYFGVQNLFTITKYSGYDPEVASIPRETLNSAATGGRSSQVNILFNRGVDARAYPRDRTYTMGLQLSF